MCGYDVQNTPSFLSRGGAFVLTVLTTLARLTLWKWKLKYFCFTFVRLWYSIHWNRADPIRQNNIVSHVQLAQANHHCVQLAGWLQPANDVVLSNRFCCVPVYKVPLNHTSKTEGFLFLVFQSVSQAIRSNTSTKGLHFFLTLGVMLLWVTSYFLVLLQALTNIRSTLSSSNRK